MVTKYDIFDYMYNKGSPIRPQELAGVFRKSQTDYHKIYDILLDLNKQKIIRKNDYGFQVVRNKNDDLLYQLIRFCIKNDINYNQILDKNIAAFISNAFLKRNFKSKDFDINPRTFSKYADILSKNGFLIVLSRKPFTGTIPYNSFLRDITAYFGQKVLVAKPRHDEYFNEIEKELKRFWRLRNMNEPRYQLIVSEHQIRFIYHSLSLEGNPITLPDTIKLLKDYIVPAEYSIESVNEVQNYQKAVKQMNDDAARHKALTIESILNYHKLAMEHRKNIAGNIRKSEVVILGNPHFQVAKTKEIRPKLLTLLNKYNQFINKKKIHLRRIMEFSAYFHSEFQHIHPFEDGNSRTTRLITFHLLQTQNIPILDIPLGLMEEYLFSTKGARTRNDAKLNQVLQQIILYNLKSINIRLSS